MRAIFETLAAGIGLGATAAVFGVITGLLTDPRWMLALSFVMVPLMLYGVGVFVLITIRDAKGNPNWPRARGWL